MMLYSHYINNDLLALRVYVDKGCSKGLLRTIVNKPPVPNLPYNETQLHGIFKRYDTDHDGCLSREELTSAFHSLGSIFPGWRALHHADANKDGYVSESEFQQLVNYAVKYGFLLQRPV
ncbi:hypothetical protein EZV62_021565 [Acer yangbiense]|uniref:EF-hand domain-containing protein n=1 Tax=Acer yangbiense TaxID=1000413 RepID=A0A5C7H868_9ROSI|nr:hypothetical protein EZV62_021565 [Acer yangbiense]